MKYFSLCTFFCVFSGATWAQSLDNEYNKETASADKAPVTSLLMNNNHRAYAAGTYGNGKIDGENTTGEKKLGWAFEVRFGKEIDIPGLGSGKLFSADEKFRVDIVHYNEGHPDNNHRDGFAVQGVYNKPLSKTFSAELGVGPYYTMNTTTIGGVQYNNSNLGVLVSTALLIDTDQFVRGTHVRVGFNHATVPGAGVHSSNAWLIGVGKYFDAPARSESASSGNPVWLGVAAINGQTNHGDTGRSFGASAEVKQYYGQWAGSVSAIAEGDDDIRVDRSGLAAQAWFIQPMTEKWTASAGLGPYVASNKRGRSDQYRVNALITMQIERSLGKEWKAFGSFSRVNTFREKNDRDLFRIGIMRSFGV